MSDENKEPEVPPTETGNSDDLAAKIESLIRKNDGKPDEAIRQLLKDNFDLREKRRNEKAEFERQLAELRGKVPGDDVVTLDKDAAGVVSRLAEMGGFEAVKERLEKAAEVEARLAKHEWLTGLQGIAEKAKFDPDVFVAMCERDGLKPDDFQVDNVGSEATPNWRVRTKDEDGKDVLLQKFAEKKWAKFLPSLRAAGPEKKSPVFRGDREPDHVDRVRVAAMRVGTI